MSERHQAEVIRLHRLNLELIDTLAQVGNDFIAYAENHGFKLRDLDGLRHLIRRADSLVKEIAFGGSLISDAILQGKRSDEDLTEPPKRLCQRVGIWFRLSNVGTC